MHKETVDGVDFFISKFMSELPCNTKVLEIGSLDWNGNIRYKFNKFIYTGCDILEVDNVDIVLKDNYNWDNIPDDSYDVIISCNTFEHIEYPWITIKEIYRILKPEGMCCIIVPQDCPEHKAPLDCYRYYPDGLRALAKHAGLTVMNVYRTAGAKWTDCMMVAKK